MIPEHPSPAGRAGWEEEPCPELALALGLVPAGG